MRFEGAAVAVAHQLNVNDVILVGNEFHIAAVLLQIGTDGIQDVFDLFNDVLFHDRLPFYSAAFPAAISFSFLYASPMRGLLPV